MDNPAVLQALGVILVLFYIFTLVMSAKNQAWFNLLVSVGLFTAATFFVIYASQVMKTRKAWMEVYNNLDKQLKPEVAKTDALLRGSPENATDPYGTLPRVWAEFQRTMVYRSRIWKGCVPDQIQPNQIVLTTPASSPPPAAAPPAAPVAPPAEGAPPADAPAPPPAEAPLEVRPNGIKEKSILFLFKENKLNESITVPFVYLGEWQVLAATDTSATLKPNIPLDAEQDAQLKGGGTFTLYEMLPVDTMAAYDAYLAQAKSDRTAQTLQAMIVKLPQTDPKVQESYDKKYPMVIDQYVRDGKEATNDDDPKNVWVLVKFLKTKEIEVDSATVQIVRDSPYFDATGLAILPELRSISGKATLGVGETALFKSDVQQVRDLIAEGVCEVTGRVFRRPLNDYKHHFHEIHNRIDRLTKRITEIKRQTAAVDVSIKETQKIIDALTESQGKLKTDLGEFKKEVVAAKKYYAKLETYRDEVRQSVNDLYRQNVALSNEITERSKKLTDDINQRTVQAANNGK